MILSLTSRGGVKSVTLVNESDLIREKAQHATALAFKHGKNAAEHGKNLMQTASTQGLPFLQKLKNRIMEMTEKPLVLSIIGLMFFILVFFDAYEFHPGSSIQSVNSVNLYTFLARELETGFGEQLLFALGMTFILMIPALTMLIMRNKKSFRIVRLVTYLIPLLLVIVLHIMFNHMHATMFGGSSGKELELSNMLGTDPRDMNDRFFGGGATNIFVWLYFLAIFLVGYAFLKFKAKQ